MGRGEKRKNKGSLGGGCFLWVFVLFAWALTHMIFPKTPGYEETMEDGEVVAGTVLAVELVDNVTINGRNPKRVVFRYGDGKEASMTMALKESASEGQELRVRVLGEHAYPEDIRPLQRPWWLKFALIGGALLGTLLLVVGAMRLLVVGGGLFAAGHALLKQKGEKGPPPPPPSSSPPPPPPPGPQG